ncbi:hypothetical protein Aph02nite_64510 [Actinoplanes philippinensis]|uniref:Uncharacterized protein n=1 Tax=Actinoplanes philippinensis TaxID=35752 RepID=A0A1I2LEQ6_9ACTN|nr:hypothetical protein [Actinoplanes philippinensis]GIE80501.1 hypothetical protein Aph02nite_64510 [Actinoplanes philippinensis]SFF77774.1 hypothetical protein SAMN05421541_121123 [Actinoplanes philippinensis]
MPQDRVDLPDFQRLTWTDVDPAGRPGFDPAAVAALVRSLPPAADVPPPGTDWRLADFWRDRMTEALVERLGPWAVGWAHTVVLEDYENRGVIPIWCTVDLPLTTPDETLDRLAQALVAWHELTVELATDSRGRFTATAPAAGSGGRLTAPAAGDGVEEPAAWRAVKAPGISRWNPGDYTRKLPHPTTLNWADVDPHTHGFDPATVADVAAGLVTAETLPAQGADWRLQDLWLESVSIGFTERYGRWALGWCWAVGESDLDGWERAVAHLVTAVGDRTGYESGWYSCCTTVLRWFLEAAGVAADDHERMLDHAIGGRFASWIEPAPEVVASVAQRLAGQVAGS